MPSLTANDKVQAYHAKKKREGDTIVGRAKDFAVLVSPFAYNRKGFFPNQRQKRKYRRQAPHSKKY